MGRFKNLETGVVFSVDDSKNSRYGGELYGDPDAESGPDYKSMKVADLRAEVAKRNEGRDEASLLSAEGNKTELVAVLEADDEANSED
jgi:hypothetical protein